MSTTAIATGTRAAPTPQVLPRPRWVEGSPSLHQITEDVARPLEGRPGRAWWICFGVAFAALLNLGGMVAYTIGSRSKQFDAAESKAALLELHSKYKWLVANEDARARIAGGQPNPRSVRVRFGNP